MTMVGAFFAYRIVVRAYADIEVRYDIEHIQY